MIEDGHWADAATLLLLRHLARSAWSARLLILATFRDTEADVPEELSETLADLRRADDVVRMRLDGLSGAEVADWSVVPPEATPTPSYASLRPRSPISPAATPFSSASSGARCVETGIVEVAGGQVTGDPPADRARHTRKRPRGGQPAAVAPGPERPPTCSSWPPSAGPEFELEPVRCAAGLAEPELLAVARGGDGQRHDRGAPLAAAGLPLHPRDRAAGAL